MARRIVLGERADGEYGLFVSARNDRVYVSSDKPSIQGFADSNLAWNKEIGGSTLTRMVGAKEAINAIFDDSSLTTGANFGFGWWCSCYGYRFGI